MVPEKKKSGRKKKPPPTTWEEVRKGFERRRTPASRIQFLTDGLVGVFERAAEEIQGATATDGLKEIRNRYLGRKRGQIKSALSYISKIPQDVRGTFGAMVNEGKREIERLLKAREDSLAAEDVSAAPAVDITLPGNRPRGGSIHPIARAVRDIGLSFERLGFSWVSGPEVESAKYNFDGLNIPRDHPARDREENFMINPAVLLRTQTSTVQVRVMESRRPPLRIIAPGRVYRPDTVDATHHFMFHQVEGLMVDIGVSFSDLKTVLGYFVWDFFGPHVRMRLRPSFFPFTEPSAEVDISCPFCRGGGCSVCKGVGWMEMAGCGMVDPAVLEFANIDPEHYTGFAFGLGVDRLAMLRHQINDIRLFTENDIRFLAQF